MDPNNNSQPQTVTPNVQPAAEPPAAEESYKARSLLSQPYASPLPAPSSVQPPQPGLAPNQPVQPQAPLSSKPLKPARKLNLPKGPALAAIIGGVVVVILLVVVLIANAGKSPKKATDEPTVDRNARPEILLPAESVQMEQTNNALAQDLSGLNDEKDLPTTSLDDQTLGL